jgi:ADP-heptose:LPS heptosyltransferase
MTKLSTLQPKKIAIFRALQIGDMLCAMPALKALRHACPDAHVTLIGLPWAESLVRRFGQYLDDFIPFPGYPGLPEQTWQPEQIPGWMQTVIGRRFDLLLQMHGNGAIVNPLVAALGAGAVAGFYEPGRYCHDPALYTPYPEEGSEVRRLLTLAEFLGAPSQGEALEFPVTAGEEQNYEALCHHYSLQPKRYVCVHPGARDTRRWWSADHFARAADDVADKGFTVVLTGTQGEGETVRSVATAMRNPSVNLAGKTDLGTLAVLVRNARMILSNDTGVSHVAAAVRTPSVVIFLASDPGRWAPLDRHRHQVILPHESEQLDYVLGRVDRALFYNGAEALSTGPAGR